MGVYTPQDEVEVSFTSPFKPQGKNKRKFITAEKIKKEEKPP
jgi:hypothetical protein